MITHEFEFEAPKALADVLELLDRHGAQAKVLAGGMSLVPMMSLGLAEPDVVISLNHLSGLDGVREEADALHIGALARHREVAGNPLVREHAPLLAEAARNIGDVQVRNRGTIGGSLSHADPAANYPPACLALGARLRLQSKGGERLVEAEAFFQGVLTTAAAPGELLTEVIVPKQAPGTGVSYQRLRRVEGAFPIVTVAAAVEPGLRAARLGMGSVAPGPVLLDVGEHLRDGLSEEAIAAVGEAAYEAAAEAPSDVQADRAYRRDLARTLARRAIRAAAEAAQ